MAATTPSTSLVPVQPAFTDSERLALAGFLAGYRGLTRDALHARPAPVHRLVPRPFPAIARGPPRRHRGLRPGTGSPGPEAPVPVAIETPRSLLVARLRAARRVCPVNPMAVARYRDRRSVAGRKSDHGDAVVLANILRTDMHAHRPLPVGSELA
jgi:hypothetical protein